MVEWCIITVEERLRKVVATHQRDWGPGILIFLLAYRASTHDTAGLTPASLVFGRELRLHCDLLFGAPRQGTTPNAANLVDHLHDIHNYARQHLKLASDRMKTRYDRRANCAGYHKGDKMWLYRPTRAKGNSPNLQLSCEGPYEVVNLINDVVYRIQRNPRSTVVVHLDWHAPYQGAVGE
jgi:hypothetical protein